VAWQRGNVDAWAALDPFLANALLKDRARVLFHKVEFNTFGVLNVRQVFLQRYPQYVQAVVKAYERARQWIIAHPDDAAAILAEAAKLDLDVAKNQLAQRTGLTPDQGVGIPGPQLKAALVGVIPVLVDEAIVKPGTDPAKSLEDLIDPTNAALAIQLATK
jgi:sulfonate transport system substrate-binding protein